MADWIDCNGWADWQAVVREEWDTFMDRDMDEDELKWDFMHFNSDRAAVLAA